MASMPRRKSWRLKFYQWLQWLRKLRTPLNLRGSIVRLRRFNKRPILALLRLFNPFPTWKFAVPKMAAAIDTLGNTELNSVRRENIIDLQNIPVWRARDTPLRSLYRMYEAMLSGVYVALGAETEYFWYQRTWSLQAIGDPQDPDPIRYAILACLVDELVVAFNWRLSLGLRRNRKHVIRETDNDPYPPYAPITAPMWTKFVPAISPNELRGLPREYVREDNRLLLESGGSNKTFASRNIITNVGWLYTI